MKTKVQPNNLGSPGSFGWIITHTQVGRSDMRWLYRYRTAPISSKPRLWPGAKNILHLDDSTVFKPRQACLGHLDQLYIWLAGLPKPYHHLQRQLLLGRAITITESPNEHLAWRETVSFVKPIPEYLLRHEFWQQPMLQDPGLYRGACGMLQTYV